MKTEYPRYENGQLQAVKKKLTAENKKILNEYIQFCAISAGQKKLPKIERVILQFYDITGKDLNIIKQADVNGFLVLLNGSDRAAWTKNEIKIYLKKFLKWKYKKLQLIENIKLSSNPFNEEKINENSYFTPQEVEAMIRAAETLKWKAWIMLAFESGARPQELQMLKWSDVKFNEEGITFISLFSGKTRKERIFPVKEATIHLKRWQQEYAFPLLQSNDLVFPSVIRGKPLTTATFITNLHKFAREAGITRNVWPYLFRHTRAHEIYKKLPTPITEKLMGHKNMYKIYAGISNNEAREALVRQVYHIEELKPAEQNELKQRMTAVEGENKELRETITKMWERLNNRDSFELVAK